MSEHDLHDLHDDALKRCPFCGGQCWTTMSDVQSRLWMVYCGDCEAMNVDTAGGFNSEQLAIEAWNKRTFPEPMPEDFKKELERLLNYYSIDAKLEMQDFLLAQNICSYLESMKLMTQQKAKLSKG